MANYKTGPGNYRSSYLRLVVSQSDQVVNNTTTLIDHDELFMDLRINTTYAFYITLIYDSGTTPDIKMGWTVPSGTSMAWQGLGFGNGQTALFETGIEVPNGGGAGAPMVISDGGRIITGSTAGFLQMQFAQNVANVSDTKVLQGTVLVVMES